MQGQYVHVSGGWPVEAFLQSWGKSAKGWHGLLAWEARVRVQGTPERVTFAAWVSAARLSRPHYVSVRKLPQVSLPANRLDWPEPQSVDVDYYLGTWDEGQPRLPEGIELDHTPAWRRR